MLDKCYPLNMYSSLTIILNDPCPLLQSIQSESLQNLLKLSFTNSICSSSKLYQQVERSKSMDLKTKQININSFCYFQTSRTGTNHHNYQQYGENFVLNNHGNLNYQ
ncbi:hypothetical protein ABPG74_021494 [Tetrahymena malaccensis]